MNQQNKFHMIGNLCILKGNKIPGKKFNLNQIIRHTIQAYYKTKNWDGLLKYLLLLEERKQLPHSWRWQIGQQHIYNNQAKKGLDYLHNLHFQDPTQPDVQLTIFDALKSLGRSENSFNWIKKPKLREIDRETLLACYNTIRQKKNAIALFILYSIIQSTQSAYFDEFDLLFALKSDSRFHIFNDTCFFRFSKIDIKAEIMKLAA